MITGEPADGDDYPLRRACGEVLVKTPQRHGPAGSSQGKMVLPRRSKVSGSTPDASDEFAYLRYLSDGADVDSIYVVLDEAGVLIHQLLRKLNRRDFERAVPQWSVPVV
jgi:hypothetical protein